MIKGVNKQILEVTNTENPYFEKIIFFVKPEYKTADRKKLQKEAEALATITQKPPKIKVPKKKILRIAVGSVLFTGAGFALSFLMNLIF
ncbi:MAG: hypothetical protein HFJ97_05655 [Eubacterium sp.]|nr:hypothetical protein [Eubacterium sp.]